MRGRNDDPPIPSAAPCPHQYYQCTGESCLYPWKCTRYDPAKYRKTKSVERNPKKTRKARRDELPDFLK